MYVYDPVTYFFQDLNVIYCPEVYGLLMHCSKRKKILAPITEHKLPTSEIKRGRSLVEKTLDTQ